MTPTHQKKETLNLYYGKQASEEKQLTEREYEDTLNSLTMKMIEFWKNQKFVKQIPILRKMNEKITMTNMKVFVQEPEKSKADFK